MRVAFLGLGIMGSRMAANLARAGHELTVWNRTSSRATELAELHPGIKVAGSPSEAAADTEIVFTMVVDGDQVQEVLLGEAGAAHRAAPGTVFVDCSTIGPSHARRIAHELADRGFAFVDAPVTGSAPRAEDGTLVFMVGAERAEFDRARPVLDAMGKLIVYAGDVGQGQTVKLINNAVAAINAVVVAQALVVGADEGANLDALVEVMGSGSGGSTMLDLKARPMITRDYTPLFKLDHMLKDVRLALEAAADAGADFSYAAGAEAILIRASAMGLGDQDFAALFEALRAGDGTAG